MKSEILNTVTDGVFTVNGDPANILDNLDAFRELVKASQDFAEHTQATTDADEWADMAARLDLDADEVSKIFSAKVYRDGEATPEFSWTFARFEDYAY